MGAANALESMGGGPQAHDRFAGVEVVLEVLHLFLRKVLEAQEDDHEVGCFQGLEAGDIGASGLDEAGLLVGGEENAALEAVVFRQDPAEGGQGLFAAVFVITGDEDDVFALAGSGLALPDHTVGVFSEAVLGGEDQKRSNDDWNFQHDVSVCLGGLQWHFASFDFQKDRLPVQTNQPICSSRIRPPSCVFAVLPSLRSLPGERTYFFYLQGKGKSVDMNI